MAKIYLDAEEKYLAAVELYTNDDTGLVYYDAEFTEPVRSEDLENYVKKGLAVGVSPDGDVIGYSLITDGRKTPIAFTIGRYSGLPYETEESEDSGDDPVQSGDNPGGTM